MGCGGGRQSQTIKPSLDHQTMRCGTTYYTPVPGITTVSLHGSALHIDTDIVDLPGWCGVPQFAMYEWMERKPPTEVEATITKAVEAIARKMGDTGKAVVLVPVWHIGGTGMAAILKHLVGKAGYDRVKVIYAIAFSTIVLLGAIVYMGQPKANSFDQEFDALMADISNLEDLDDEEFEMDPAELAQAEKDSNLVHDLME